MRLDARPIDRLPPLLLRKVGPYAPFMCERVGTLPFIRTRYFATILKPQSRIG